jgi:hypothetical protein
MSIGWSLKNKMDMAACSPDKEAPKRIIAPTFNSSCGKYSMDVSAVYDDQQDGYYVNVTLRKIHNFLFFQYLKVIKSENVGQNVSLLRAIITMHERSSDLTAKEDYQLDTKPSLGDGPYYWSVAKARGFESYIK